MGMILDHNECPFPIFEKSDYEAANVAGLSAWHTGYKAENDAFLRSRKKIVARAKDIARNESLTRASIQQKVNLTIGANWTVSPAPDLEMMPWDAAKNREFVKSTRKKFMRDMGSSNRWIDASGKNNFIDLLRLDLRTGFIEGESFLAINRIKEPRGPIGFNVQVIDPGRVDTPDQFLTDENVTQGIRMSRSGFVRGYYIHRYHKHSLRNNGKEQYQYINQFDDFGRTQVMHNFVQTAPDLIRGITELSTSVINAKKKGKMVDAALEDFITKSQIALVIRSDKADIAEAFGVSEEDAHVYKMNFMKQYMTESGKFHQTMGIEHDNKQLLRLFDGEQLDGFAPDTHGGNFQDFCKNIDAMEARSHGLSVETHTQRWNETNYSGARAGGLSDQRNVNTWRSQPEKTSQIIWEVWLEDAILSGKVQLPGIESALQGFAFYLENKDALCAANWFGPAKDEIDEAKRAARFESEKSIGVHTFERYCRTVLGEDPEDVLDQKFDELKMVNDRLKDCGYQEVPDPLRFLFPGWDLVQTPALAPVQQSSEDN